MKLVTLLCLSLLCSFYSYAQNADTLIVRGRIIDLESRKPISDVNITLKGSTFGTTSNQYGTFEFTVISELPAILQFSHVSYTFQQRTLTTAGDHRLNLELNRKQSQLPEFELQAGPEIVYGNQEFQLLDYTFYGDDVLLLAYPKKPVRSSLILVSEGEKVLATKRVPRQAISLYSDCQGDPYVITQDFLFQASYEQEELQLTFAETNRYNHLIQPCVAYETPFFYFSRFGPGHFSVEYTLVDVDRGERRPLRRVIDKEILKAFREENLHVGNSDFDREMNHRLATINNEQKMGAISAQNRSMRELVDERRFLKEMHFKPVYAPLAAINEQLFIFDHLNSQLFQMELNGTLLDSVVIDYHNDRRWQREIIVDQHAGIAYAHYNKNGYAYLLPIDTETGQVGNAIRLEYRYPEKIKVRDGVVYYLYRPFGSIQRKYLYKENL